ncbi:MAG: NAD(P)-dependent glycerol-1-phosphate dehydrogenase [Thermoplasmata archaeon]
MEDFTKSKSMELPRKVVIGHNAVLDVGEVCAELKIGKKSMVVCDSTTKEIAGNNVADALQALDFSVTQRVIEDASVEAVDSTAGELEDGGFDFVLGVGGGRPIDVAKCSSNKVGLPFLSVPTAASHDGIVSSRGSLNSENGKVSVAARTPIAVIMDTAILAESPYKLLAAGCGDIISNSTAVKDWILARKLKNEYFSSYAASLSRMTASLLIENAGSIKPRLEESAWFVAKALVSSGVAMSIAGSSRPASGSEHKFSHALDLIAEKPGLHGEHCGVGTIMMMYLHGGDWERIRDALLAIGAPTTARTLGVTDDEIIEALIHAHEINKERYTILGDEGVTHEAAEHLASITKVI